MAPAVPLADPGEPPPLGQPAEVVVDVHPRLVALGQDRARPARGRVPDHDVESVLEAVQALQHDLVRVAGPVHPCQVLVARVARHLDPADVASRGAHHPHPDRGVGLARLRVRERGQGRVQRRGVVDQGEVPDPFAVDLPEGDLLPVGAEAPAVTQPQLLLVDPVEGPVHERRASVPRERRDRAPGQVLDVEVALPNVSHAPAVRRELGEHQGRRPRVPAQLPELRGREVEDPVVAPAVGSPHAARLGEHQQLPAVGRPGIVGDLDRRGGARRDQARGRDQHLAAARGGVVEHQLTNARAIGGRSGRGAGGRLERRVGGASPEPAGGAEALGLELPRGEDAFEREERGVRRLGRRRRCDQAQQQGGADESSGRLHGSLHRAGLAIVRRRGCDSGGYPGAAIVSLSSPGRLRPAAPCGTMGAARPEEAS